MRWATRRGCHVDRTACAWLIKRYLDPEAALYFFGDPTEAPEGAELFAPRRVPSGTRHCGQHLKIPVRVRLTAKR